MKGWLQIASHNSKYRSSSADLRKTRAPQLQDDVELGHSGLQFKDELATLGVTSSRLLWIVDMCKPCSIL